jgi:diguanylate cyclase (GGDEF)-like protein
LDGALARAARTGLRVGVLYLDLDNFKAVNDTLGHVAGDELLVAVAERLNCALRVGDVAGRLGGDEFLVVAEHVCTEEALAELVKRVETVLQQPVVVGERRVVVGASVGAVLSRSGDVGSTVVRRADAAMFAAKRARRPAATPVPRGPALAAGCEADTPLHLPREPVVVAEG